MTSLTPLRVLSAPVMALVVAATALGAAATPVIAPSGRLAGHGYGQWLQISLQSQFGEPPNPPVCQTVHTPTGPVAMLAGGASGKKETDSCSEPANRPIYVPGFNVECSTVEAPPFHGNTPAQLKSCARKEFKPTTGLSASIDGRSVPDYKKFIAASPVFTFHLPGHNILGSRRRSGRSAAYGVGLLLRGFAAGRHTIHVTGHQSGFTVDVTYALHVR